MLCKQVMSWGWHNVSQTWEMVQTGPAFKEKERPCSVQNVPVFIICGVLWQTEQFVLSDCKILFSEYSSEILLYHTAIWNTNKRGTKGNKFKRENQVGMSFTVFMQWIWEFGLCLWWCYGSICVCNHWQNYVFLKENTNSLTNCDSPLD